MKRYLFLFLALLAAAPRATSHVHQVIHDGDVIRCPVNLLCEIELPATEALDGTIRYGSAPADGKRQQTRDWVVIGDHGPPARIIVKPLRVGAFTNVLIPTTDHDRVVFLQAVAATDEPDRTALNLVFAPPTPPPAPIVYATVAPPTPTPSPASMLSYVDMATFHCDEGATARYYRVSGDAPFRPTRVCVDRNRTYIEIPNGVALPALGAVAADGHTVEFIEPHFQDGVFIDPGHRAHYVLIEGSGRATITVHIDRVGDVGE